MNKRNTIVICSDEHHFLKAGYRGHPYVQTPNLDALAGEGAAFTHCYCNSPVCGPSRMSFITGKYVHQIDSWFNCVPLREEEATWPSRLSGAGVESTMLGKMHFAGPYQSGGFDHYQIIDRQGAFSPYPRVSPLPSRLGGFVRAQKRSLLKRAGVRKPLFTDGHDIYSEAVGVYDHDRHVTLWAKEYLQQKAGSSEPWVLYLGYLQPHWPFTCPEEYFRLYYPNNLDMPFDCHMPDNQALHPAVREFQQGCNLTGITEDDIRRTLAAYYGMITCMDDMIGQVLDTLKGLGLYQDTTIIYTSDHGENCGEHGLFYKQCPYDSATAVPLIVKGPDIAAGQVVDTPVSLVDLYPTLLDRYGLPVEADRPGKSWLPLLQGQGGYGADSVFAEYHGNFFRNAWYMLVRDGYKYVYHVHGRPSLFNLVEDPRELKDLAEDPAYGDTLRAFEGLLRAQVDPEAVDLRSKRDLGLLSPDGTDYTQTLTWPQLQQAMEAGDIPFQSEWGVYQYEDYMQEH